MKYSVITPSAGLRPLALGRALDSVLTAAQAAGLVPDVDVELLVGFDGVRGERVREATGIRYFDLPATHDFGNSQRQALLRAARGQRVLLVDDDNELTPEAFCIHEEHRDADMVVARIDVSLAHPIAWLPVHEEGKPVMRPGNVDPLCLCLSRDLVLVRCQGWQGGVTYESDYHNMLRYWRRARRIVYSDRVVGIYDAGRGLDAGGVNFRQKACSPAPASTRCD